MSKVGTLIYEITHIHILKQISGAILISANTIVAVICTQHVSDNSISSQKSLAAL